MLENRMNLRVTNDGNARDVPGMEVAVDFGANVKREKIFSLIRWREI